MKAKKLLPVLALALAATTFSACGEKTVSLGKYWQLDATAKESFYEQAVYNVSSKSTESSYCNYTVEYTGTFITTLESVTALDYDYVFTTALEVTATFKVDGEEETVTDTATTEVKFVAEDNLRPVSASKTMSCHVPLQGTFTSVNNCYTFVEYEYTVNYTQDDKGKIAGHYDVIQDDDKTTFPLEDTFSFMEDYTYIDNESLLVAVRAFDVEESSATVSTYGVFTESTQKVKFTFSNPDEKADKTFNYTKINADGTETAIDKELSYRIAKISLDQSNPGGTQVINFAKNESPNAYHNVILQITTPLSFGMGEIYYKLAKVSYFKA